MTEDKKTHIDLMDVADFMFGIRSIERIAKGEGSWGDLKNVGVTAATFLIPPAKLLGLSGKALNKVVASTGKVIDNPVASEAAKRAARRTLDQAQVIARQRKTPFEAQDIADLTVTNPRLSPGDVVAARGGLMEESAYVAKTLREYSPDDFVGSEWDEIFKKITINKNIKMTEEVKDTMVAYKGFINSGNPVPKWLKQDMKRAGIQVRGEKIAAQVEKEMPAKLPKEARILEEVDEETGKVIRTIKEPEDYLNDPLPENPTAGMVTREVPTVDRIAYLRNQIDKFENFNKASHKKIEARTNAGKKADDLWAQVEENNKLIEKYRREYNQKSTKLNIDERKLADQKAKEARYKSKFKEETKVDEAAATRREIENTKKQIEVLRNKWSNAKKESDKTKFKEKGQALAKRLQELEGK